MYPDAPKSVEKNARVSRLTSTASVIVDVMFPHRVVITRSVLGCVRSRFGANRLLPDPKYRRLSIPKFGDPNIGPVFAGMRRTTLPVFRLYTYALPCWVPINTFPICTFGGDE